MKKFISWCRDNDPIVEGALLVLFIIVVIFSAVKW